MKNLILIILLSTMAFGQNELLLFFDNQTYTTNVLVVGANAPYKTIASALNDYTEDKLIYLLPEYFNEDVTISTDSVKILGASKELTRIKSIVVNGSNAHLKCLSILGDATFTSQETWDWYGQGILVENVDFFSALNVGTSTTVLQESITMYDCSLISTDKDFTINCYNGNNTFYDFRMQQPSGSPGSDMIIYGGRLEFEGGKGIFIDTLRYMTAGTYSQTAFFHIYPLSIGRIITANSTQYHVLTIGECRGDLGFASGGSDFTINGKFEFNILESSMAIWDDIIFNSTARSRFIEFMQRGYTSNTTISGSGLAYLYIYNSVLKCADPTGLGANTGTIWGAFVDD